MSYKREGLLLSEQTQTTVDHELFARLKATRGDTEQTYVQLTPSIEKKEIAMESWRRGDNVDLTVDNLDISYLQTQADKLEEYDRMLYNNYHDMDSDVVQLYRLKLVEHLAKSYIVEASNNKNMKDFRDWNECVYGKPDENIYKAALDWVGHDAEELVNTENQHPIVIDSAQKVLELLSGKRGNRELISPSDDVFEKVRNDHMRPMGYYGLLLAGVTMPTGKVTKVEGDSIIKHVIENNLKSDYVVADAEGSTWSVSHIDKSVRRPYEYNMPPERFIGLGLGHEIGSHLLERVNGGRGPLELASIGLPNYEAGNEGRAVIREQIRYKTFEEFSKTTRWHDIMRRHIAISYAWGAGDEDPKSSADVFKFMNAIDTMYQAKLSTDEPELINKKAAKKTTDLLLRVLKGTDGNGGAYLKDKVYLEGNVSCWKTAEQFGADAISYGDLGKFDINNSLHVTALQRLGLKG